MLIFQTIINSITLLDQVLECKLPFWTNLWIWSTILHFGGNFQPRVKFVKSKLFIKVSKYQTDPDTIFFLQYRISNQYQRIIKRIPILSMRGKWVFWIEFHQKQNRSVISYHAWAKEREWWLGMTINGLENLEFVRLILLWFYLVGFEYIHRPHRSRRYSGMHVKRD